MHVSFAKLLAGVVVDLDGVEPEAPSLLFGLGEEVRDFVAALFLFALPGAFVAVARLGALVVVLHGVLYTAKGVAGILLLAQALEAVEFAVLTLGSLEALLLVADRHALVFDLGALAGFVVLGAHFFHLLLEALTVLGVLLALAVHDLGHRLLDALLDLDRGAEVALLVELADLDFLGAVACVVNRHNNRRCAMGDRRFHNMGLDNMGLDHVVERALASVAAGRGGALGLACLELGKALAALNAALVIVAAIAGVFLHVSVAHVLALTREFAGRGTALVAGHVALLTPLKAAAVVARGSLGALGAFGSGVNHGVLAAPAVLAAFGSGALGLAHFEVSETVAASGAANGVVARVASPFDQVRVADVAALGLGLGLQAGHVASLVPEVASVFAAAGVARCTRRALGCEHLRVFGPRFVGAGTAAAGPALGSGAFGLAHLNRREASSAFGTAVSVDAMVAGAQDHLLEAKVGAHVLAFSFAAVAFAGFLPEAATDIAAAFETFRTRSAFRFPLGSIFLQIGVDLQTARQGHTQK